MKLLSRFFAETPSVDTVVTRDHAAWLLGGLASALRRPAPRLDLPAEVDAELLLSAARDCGFKPTWAKISALLDTSTSQTSCRWSVFVPVDESVRPALLLGLKDEKWSVLVAGEPAPRSVNETELRTWIDRRGLVRLEPDVVTEEEQLEGFGWRWFARAFFARKAVVRDVVLASFLVALVGLAYPLATQAIVDKVITNQATSTLIALGVGIALMAVFSGVMGWLRQKFLLRLANVMDAELSQRVLLHLLQLPLRYFQGRATGTLINKVYGIERIREFFAGAFLLCALDLPFMVVFLVLMLTYSTTLSAVVLGFLFVMVALSFAVGPALKARADRSMQLQAKVQGFLTEQVGAVETLKSLQLEPTVSRQYQTLNEAQLDATLKLREFANGYSSFMQVAEQLMNAAVLCIGAYLAMTGDALTIGMLVAFQMFAQRVAQPLLKLSGMWQEFQQVRVAAKMVGDIVNQPTERYSQMATGAPSSKGQLQVQALSYRHAEDLPPLYKDLSFEAPAGQTLLVTGPSGCGKSTLAKLLLGLYTGFEGTIRIDGRDTRSMTVNELRATFGVVPQESVLFSGTIIENLLSVSPTATMERAVLACKMAGVHGVIENLPEGYQTKVGERGAGLSGGQRQRLAIARALLKQPRVLIFDEAVASLDDAAAAQVADAVNSLRGKVTVIFITHKVPANLVVDGRLELKPSP